MNLIKRLYQEEEGQGLTEYALILAAVVLIGVAVAAVFKPNILNLFNLSTNAIDGFEDKVK